jgi:hypothetical protein
MVDANDREDLSSLLVGMVDADGVALQVQTRAGRLDVEGVEEFSHASSQAGVG